jgi:large subunit ribosomal protein L15
MKDEAMHVGDLKPRKGAVKDRKRVGRGPACGQGGTSGRGHKGQGARKGKTAKFWFEGGQMPLKRRLPKRGFTNVHAAAMESLNLRDLARLGAAEITPALLVEKGLMARAEHRLKVLAVGEVTSPLVVHAHAFSKGAKVKIEAAGGKAEVIPVPKRPKRYKPKANRGK